MQGGRLLSIGTGKRPREEEKGDILFSGKVLTNEGNGEQSAGGLV
jgi:hypothetical protein